MPLTIKQSRVGLKSGTLRQPVRRPDGGRPRSAFAPPPDNSTILLTQRLPGVIERAFHGREHGVTRSNEQDPRPRLTACPFCGLLQHDAVLEDGESARCARCCSTIRTRKPLSIDRTLALCVSGLLLFLPANLYPILRFTAVGRGNDNRLLTGVVELFEGGATIVGLLVLLASVLAPLARFACGVAVLLPIRLGHPERCSRMLRRGFDGLARWAMLDVYLLAVVVAYAKLSNFGDSSLDAGWYPLLGLIVVSILVSLSYDPDAVREAVDGPSEPVDPGPTRQSLRITEPLLVAAAILFIPSYTLPVLNIVEYGVVHEDTVYAAVLELTSGGQYLLGGLMFCASIIVPTLKLLVLTLLVVSIRAGWVRLMPDRLALYRVVEAIGRWSFVDLFVVSILVALAELGVFATASPGPGLVFFAGVVVCTMLAAMSLDPRLIWEPEGARR
jgi:paraquat-inducible protein A